MRTETVTMASCRPPREPSPRRFVRPGVTRMVRSTAIPLLILAGMALTPTEVGAASITYSIVNFPALQNGYTVTGTITTNGTTGTTLPSTDITSWDITILLGSTTVATLTPADTSNLAGSFDATSTTISVASPLDVILIANPSFTTSITWENELPTVPFIEYKARSDDTDLWVSGIIDTASPIATVPEPSSAVLASIGAVVAFLAYGWSRHRRVQHRLEAN